MSGNSDRWVNVAIITATAVVLAGGVASYWAHDANAVAEQGLRAYMGADGAFIEGIESKQPTIHVTLRNFGRTPARSVEAGTWYEYANSTVGKNPSGHGFGLVDSGRAEKALMVPGDIFTARMAELKTREAIFYVGTVVTYQDVFGACYRREFAHHLTPELMSDPARVELYPVAHRSKEASIDCRDMLVR